MIRKVILVLRQLISRFNIAFYVFSNLGKAFLERTLSKWLQSFFSHINWIAVATCFFAFLLGGGLTSWFCGYPLTIFAMVYICCGMITLISIIAEEYFIKKIRIFQQNLLGHSSSYNHNQEISILITTAARQWEISGSMLLKILGTLLFFGILGILLLETYPPMYVLGFFLCMFSITVGFSMIGYHQYIALFDFITRLSEKYEPSKRTITWMTEERNAWLVQLATLYDFMSAAFFLLAMLYVVACCCFCFHPAFGVLSNASFFRIFLLSLFWLKVLSELTVKYVRKLFIGKRKLKMLAQKIKETHINMVQTAFQNPIRTSADYTGYNLYLQLQRLELLPEINTVARMIQSISVTASCIVTVYSLVTILQTVQAKLV